MTTTGLLTLPGGRLPIRCGKKAQTLSPLSRQSWTFLAHLPPEHLQYAIVATLVDALPAGSYVVLAHPASDIRAARMAEMTKRVNERMSGPKATIFTGGLAEVSRERRTRLRAGHRVSADLRTRSALRRQVGASHRTLSTYVNTLRAHDLWLDHVAEPAPAPGWGPGHDADRQLVHLVARMLKVIR